MIDSAYIRIILKSYIDIGKREFIIYPFGANGVNVRNILYDYFNLQPCYIVDNVYSKYNINFIDIEKLKKAYHEGMYIILTIENEDLNTELADELREFVPQANIINLFAIMKHKEEEDQARKNIESKARMGFRLQDFLPVMNRQAYHATEGKIKVRITYSNSNFWNAINLLIQAFYEDSIFDVVIIIAAITDCEAEKITKQLLQKGYRYFLFDEYQLEWDKPDILILTNSFDKMASQEKNSRKYARLIVAEDMQLIWYKTESVDQFWEKREKAYERHQPDFYLYDSLLYQEIKGSRYFSEKIIEMGNPKFDGIYAMIQNKKYFGRWEKLKSKKCVLWTTGHGIGINSFDLYAKTIFEYAANHLEFGLIFRPHHAFIEEMLNFGYWSTEDLKKLKKYCDYTANVVYDDTETYDISMSISDGILTDVFCGIICSALPTLKPICVTYRSKEVIPCHEELLKNYYCAYNTKDIKVFFDMILNGKDTMLHLRKQASKIYIKNFDGKNSLRVKEFVKEKYFDLVRIQEAT